MSEHTACEVAIPVRPRNSMVLIEVLPEDEMTKSGLYLAHVAKKARKGVVRGVGPGKAVSGSERAYRMPMDLQVGDVVYLPDDRYRCEVESDGVKYVLVPEDAIPGVLEQ